MAISLKHRLPNGETRAWTLKEIVQGKPVDRPTHPMVVHFPIAFYIGALALDVLSHLGRFPAAPLAGSWLILGAFAGTLAAVATGLADRSTFRPGSRVRKVATRHMLVQFSAAAVFIVNFILRWPHRHDVHSSVAWIVLDVIGVLLVGFGADLGGQMVYKMGVRVGTAED
jgi:uncharacterized membrane protein